MDFTPREAARRTYVIDDFERWDDAIHAAAEDFERAFGAYPTHAAVHPGSLERFGRRASPEKLRDADGDAPEEGDLDDAPHLGEFATDDYVLAFEEDPQLWPVELVLWLGPTGACRPKEDSPPPSPLTAAQTDLDAPTVVRARHTRMLIVAGQCLDCRHVVTPRTCTAFPDGIPLAIASSRHDHREPFAGDGGVRFERSTDDGLSVRGLYAILANEPGRALAPEDAPADGPAAREVDVFGDDANAPERFDRDVARGRAKARLTQLVHEAGGPEACTPDDLCRWLTQAYPVTRALLDRNEKGGPEAWRRYIAQWHRAQLRRKRPATGARGAERRPGATRCPRCDRAGPSIGRVTLEGQLSAARLGGLVHLDGWRVCTTEACEVAYFRGDAVICVAELPQVPFHKSDDASRLVCFCFGHTVAAVEADVAEHGTSTIQASIKAACGAGRDDCEKANPQGRCCLGNVGLVVKRAAGPCCSAEMVPEPKEDCCAPRVGGARWPKSD